MNTWFAICLVGEGPYICNIKLDPIQWLLCCNDLSLFICERVCWVQGYANEVIGIIREWAFGVLALQKLNAVICTRNLGSRLAFKKCGFEQEDTLCEEVVSAGQRLDVWCIGLPRSHWSPSS